MAEAIVRMLVDARGEALKAAGDDQRHLNLAATHALSYTFVPKWLVAIGGPAEIGALNLISDTHQQCVRLMKAGAVNFFVSHMSPAGADDLPEQQFNRHPIGRDRLIPLCAPDSQGRPRWTLGAEGAEVPFIAYAAASGFHAILKAHWARHGRPGLAPMMNSVLAATNLTMAKEGQGVAFLPHSLAEGDIERGRLVRAGGAALDVPVQIVVFRPRPRMSPHHEAFWRNLLAATPADD
ncbi:substrate-binding domain-containing protein [Acuticoccus sp. M5D2P5]|uniref:LysR substrate-binding domain-containing protein n=1 Tax=Acuticoccus kalidii TaxID=2910977 RepID=UPI001F3D32B3|nr:LysR substrate-binding domain-containing protein [Acuticoccus kalidii]MCF3934077.1 substrate-binding domain-containing protein [Acuticoccus kalidii]